MEILAEWKSFLSILYFYNIHGIKKKCMQTHIRKANLGTGWELERKKMQADKDSLLLLISINLQV